MTYQERIEAAAERAAIMEHDGGVERSLAELAAANAYDVTVKEIRRHFEERA